MKKLLIIAIAAFAFTACNNDAAKTEGTGVDTPKVEATVETTAPDTTGNWAKEQAAAAEAANNVTAETETAKKP